MSSEKKELYRALSAFQGQLKAVEKKQVAKIQMKKGGMFSFKYADLSDIWDVIREPLSKNGLSLVQIINFEEHFNYLYTSVYHESGEMIQSKMRIDPGDDIKLLGANITYYRRYALSAMLGIVSEDDADKIPVTNPTPQEKKQRSNQKANPPVPRESLPEKKAVFPEKIVSPDWAKEDFMKKHGMDKEGSPMKAYLLEVAARKKLSLNEIVQEAIDNEELFLAGYDKIKTG